MGASDSDRSFDIHVRTDYDGAAAKEAIADQDKLAEATARTTQTGTQGGGEDVATQRIAARNAAFDRYAASVAAENAEELSAETKKAVAQEQQLIVATRRSMVEAMIAGDKTELAKLQAELGIRQLTIQTLRTEAMTQTEINALLADQNVLMEQAAAAAAAQASVEGGRMHGREGHLGNLARDFGMDSNSAVSIGMGVMFGMELKRLIEEQTKELDKQSEAMEKSGEELQKQIRAHHEALEAARSGAEVAKVRTKIEEEINALVEKRFLASGKEKEYLYQRIMMLQTELRIAANWPASQLARKNAEEELREKLEGQAGAMKKQLDLSSQLRQDAELRLQQENALADAKLKIALAQVKIDEDAGKISHEEAANQRGKLSASAEDDKAQREQEALKAKKQSLEKDSKAAADAQATAEKEAEEARTRAESKAKEVAAAIASQQQAQSTKQLAERARKDAEILAAKASSERETELATGARAPGIHAVAAESANIQAQQAERKAQTAGARAVDPKRLAELEKENDSLNTQVADAEKAARDAKDDAEKKLATNGREIHRIDQEMQYRPALKTETDKAREMAQAEARTQAQKRDKEERDRADAKDALEAEREARKAEKQRKVYEKAGGYEVEAGAAAAATTAKQIAGGGFNTDAVVQRAASAVSAHPTDTTAQQALVAALDKLISTMGLGDEQRRKQAQALEAQIKQLEQKTQQLQRQLANSRS